jgi:hypothetical protein
VSWPLIWEYSKVKHSAYRCAYIWQTLCVPPDSSFQVIQSSFRTLSKILHPDKGGNTSLMQRVSPSLWHRTRRLYCWQIKIPSCCLRMKLWEMKMKDLAMIKSVRPRIPTMEITTPPTKFNQI